MRNSQKNSKDRMGWGHKDIQKTSQDRIGWGTQGIPKNEQGWDRVENKRTSQKSARTRHGDIPKPARTEQDGAHKDIPKTSQDRTGWKTWGHPKNQQGWDRQEQGSKSTRSVAPSRTNTGRNSRKRG